MHMRLSSCGDECRWTLHLTPLLHVTHVTPCHALKSFHCPQRAPAYLQPLGCTILETQFCLTDRGWHCGTGSLWSRVTKALRDKVASVLPSPALRLWLTHMGPVNMIFLSYVSPCSVPAKRRRATTLPGIPTTCGLLYFTSSCSYHLPLPDTFTEGLLDRRAEANFRRHPAVRI